MGVEESSSPASHCPHRRSLCAQVRRDLNKNLENFNKILSEVLTLFFSRKPEDFRVSFGDHQVMSSASPWDKNEVRMDIEEFIVHPGYKL